MRLTVTTVADPRSGLFVDRPGEIYGSCRYEGLARYPLQVLKNVYDSFLEDQRREAAEYGRAMEEYGRKLGKFESVSKRRRSALGMKAPEKPAKPDAMTPAANRVAKSVMDGTAAESMRIVIDSLPVVKGGKAKLDVRIRIERPDMSKLSVRAANMFNRLGGLNRHAHWLARDYERTFREIFDNSARYAACDMRGSTVRIEDLCPLPPEELAEFEENCRKAFNGNEKDPQTQVAEVQG